MARSDTITFIESLLSTNSDNIDLIPKVSNITSTPSPAANVAVQASNLTQLDSPVAGGLTTVGKPSKAFTQTQKFNTILGGINTGVGTYFTLLGNKRRSEVYKASGAASMATAVYNSELIKAESAQELSAMTNRIGAFLSAQRAQIAASGQGLSSQSALAIMNDTLVGLEKAALDLRNTTQQQVDATIYEGAVAQWHAGEKAKQSKSPIDLSGIVSGITSLVKLF